jgi:hypothetical protein
LLTPVEPLAQGAPDHVEHERELLHGRDDDSRLHAGQRIGLERVAGAAFSSRDSRPREGRLREHESPSGDGARLFSEMTTIAATRFESLSLDELEDELATLASHLYAGTCRWLELVRELDRRGSWAECGQGSCAEWLAWRCGLAPRAAREHVRVARWHPELPL